MASGNKCISQWHLDLYIHPTLSVYFWICIFGYRLAIFTCLMDTYHVTYSKWNTCFSPNLYPFIAPIQKAPLYTQLLKPTPGLILDYFFPSPYVKSIRKYREPYPQNMSWAHRCIFFSPTTILASASLLLAYLPPLSLYLPSSSFLGLLCVSQTAIFISTYWISSFLCL